MTSDSNNYNLFYRFIETFMSSGFKEIDENNTLMLELEEMMEKNNQFFYIADVIKIKILYTSKRSVKMIGILPEELDFSHFMEAVHPIDIQRLNLGRTKLLKTAQDFFMAEKGEILLSTNMRLRDAAGEYSNFLLQNYLFYTTIPYKTVYFLKVHTNINWSKKIRRSYHYYIGNDMSYFRFPDDDYLKKGSMFSKREFQIIGLIEEGKSSKEIARELFISIHTVETHRRNILAKTNLPHISSLILDLKERGIL